MCITMMSEEMERQCVQVCTEVATRIRSKEKVEPYWIGVCGIPGAGKSTFCEFMIQHMRRVEGIACECIPMDGYHYYRAELDQFPDKELAHERRGAPFTFNVEKFLRDLRKCRGANHGVFKFPSFDHAVKDPCENDIAVDLDRVQLIVVEGNYLLLDQPPPWNELKGLFHETWYLQVDINTAIERVAQRAMKAWNWTYDKALQRAKGSDAMNMKLIVDQNPHERCDKIIYSL